MILEDKALPLLQNEAEKPVVRKSGNYSRLLRCCLLTSFFINTIEATKKKRKITPLIIISVFIQSEFMDEKENDNHTSIAYGEV